MAVGADAFVGAVVAHRLDAFLVSACRVGRERLIHELDRFASEVPGSCSISHHLAVDNDLVPAGGSLTVLVGARIEKGAVRRPVFYSVVNCCDKLLTVTVDEFYLRSIALLEAFWRQGAVLWPALGPVCRDETCISGGVRQHLPCRDRQQRRP